MFKNTYKLGKLRRPQIGGDDTVSWNPVSVNFGKSLLCSNTFSSLKSTDQNTIGVQQILNGGTLCQEFGVGTDVEVNSRSGVGLQNGAHALGSTARNSRLLDNDLGALRNFGNTASGTFDIAGNHTITTPNQ